MAVCDIVSYLLSTSPIRFWHLPATRFFNPKVPNIGTGPRSATLEFSRDAEGRRSINMGILETMVQLWKGECGVGKESKGGAQR